MKMRTLPKVASISLISATEAAEVFPEPFAFELLRFFWIRSGDVSLLRLFFLRDATNESVDEPSEVLVEDDEAEESLELDTSESLRLFPIFQSNFNKIIVW